MQALSLAKSHSARSVVFLWMLAATTFARTAAASVSIGSQLETVQVVANEVPLLVRPEPTAARRGTLQRGAVAVVHLRRNATGCSGSWVLVGPAAWACDSREQFSPRGPNAREQADLFDVIEYARIPERGAIGFRTLEHAAEQLPDAELQPGFFVGIVEERDVQGEPFGRTTHDIWIARRDLVNVGPSSFEGTEIEAADTGSIARESQDEHRGASKGKISSASLNEPTAWHGLPFGWIYVDNAVPKRRIQGAPVSRTVLPRLTRLRILEHRKHSDHRDWYRVADGWLSDQQIRIPNPTVVPEGLQPNERWIDIDRQTQTLLAYAGQVPVFATLVSTGRGAFGSPTETPPGLHRIWVKLTSADMDNLDELAQGEGASAPAPYAVEAVPFVMFFLRGYGLHATYWHDGFGTPRSHGCVNLSVRDAARLFEFASPKLAPGWQAAHPYAYDPGTLVRVR